MLSKREFDDLSRKAHEYDFPMVESALLRELLDDYARHHPEVISAPIIQFPETNKKPSS